MTDYYQENYRRIERMVNDHVYANVSMLVSDLYKAAFEGIADFIIDECEAIDLHEAPVTDDDWLEAASNDDGWLEWLKEIEVRDTDNVGNAFECGYVIVLFSLRYQLPSM